jgi:hypothetical protein
MPSRPKMTGWYDPVVRLLTIGIRVAEATVFGKVLDRRELIAALDPFERPDSVANCDFSSILIEQVPASDDGALLPRLVESPIELRSIALACIVLG